MEILATPEWDGIEQLEAVARNAQVNSLPSFCIS